VAGFAVDTAFQNPPTNVECGKAVANSMEKTGEGTLELQNHPAISCYMSVVLGELVLFLALLRLLLLLLLLVLSWPTPKSLWREATCT